MALKLFRIGNKVVSREKLFETLDELLADREAGATQEEVARTYSVQRTFVSVLESIGEIRRGARIAIVGFPIKNAAEIQDMAQRKGVDFVLVFSQEERESIENLPGADVFNRLLETLATLRDYDVVILMASDWRIELIERILGTEVITIPLGESPLREAVTVDIDELEALVDGVLEGREAKPHSGRVSTVLRDAAGRAKGWAESKRS